MSAKDCIIYRRHMVCKLQRYMESRAEGHALNQRHAGEMKALADGYDPYMLDVANLASLSWDYVSRIKNCALLDSS